MREMTPDRVVIPQRFGKVLNGLRCLRARSALALLGIAIGSSSITAMINIGHNATENALEVFKDMGTDTVVAHIPSSGEGEVALDHDAMRKLIPEMGISAIAATGYENVIFRGKTHTISLVGTSVELSEVLSWQMEDGRSISKFDGDATFVVVGHDLAQSLADGGKAVELGEHLRLGHYLYTIIGTMKKAPDNFLIPFRTDETLFIPIESMRRLTGRPQVDTVIAKSGASYDPPTIALALKKTIEHLLPGREITVRFPQQMIEGMRSQTQTFNYLLIALGSISLIGSGVGVMNVMLMNVSERRREIGIRIALGARRVDIRNLFLGEAMKLTFTGALIGVSVGIVMACLYANITGWTFSLTSGAVILGGASTLLVGLFFGIYPAIAAARLQPVQALRDA